MTHKVAAGETLSGIAKAHGVTLPQLLAVNPKFSAHPDRIKVGDVITIPAGGAAPPPAAPAAAPAPSSGHELGKLSEKFEARGPGTVSGGQGDAGGRSYGSWQMTSKPNGGTVKRFVNGADFPFKSKFAGLEPGATAFTKAWKDLATADPDGFKAVQHAFIKRTHFDLLVKKIQEAGLDVLTRSHALQDVIWSTAVQHGPASGIPTKVLATIATPQSDPDFDKRLITAIYAERGRKRADGVLVHFSKNSAAVQKGVASRFTRELKDALAMLEKES